MTPPPRILRALFPCDGALKAEAGTDLCTKEAEAEQRRAAYFILSYIYYTHDAWKAEAGTSLCAKEAEGAKRRAA